MPHDSSARYDVLVKAENRGVVVTEASSYVRLIDSGITQFKAHRPPRTCNESKEEEQSLNPKIGRQNTEPLPTETKVESGTSQSKSGTSVN